MPEKGSNVQFNNYSKQLQAPFVTYVDFESNLKEVRKPNRDNGNASCTDKCQKYIACSYGYKYVWLDDRFSKPVQIYRGENAVYKRKTDA